MSEERERVDLLIHSASQVLTLAGGPQRGRRLGQLAIIEGGAVAIDGGRITEVGDSDLLRGRLDPSDEIDAAGRVVMPGFVDPHTHLIWAGDRSAEFEQRLAGVPYLEILKQGGGILSTVRQTREASQGDLVEAARPRLQRMLQYGTTTAEAKTGYGLDTETEIRMLAAVLALDGDGPCDLAPTLLGGHAVPPEFEGDPDGYCAMVCDQMLPAARDWWGQHAGARPLPFFDVFCEEGAFDVEQSRRMLTAAAKLGFSLKVHADEFVGLGGTALAVELGATSVDHLVETPPDDIAAVGNSVTVAVALPCTPFGLGQERYTPAAAFLEAGAVLAIATDLNPGTAPCESMQFAIAVACRQMGLTPAQAIAAATINAAAAIGLAEDRGGLEQGMIADLLILDADDYRQLGYRFGTNLVAQVIKRGQAVWSA
ncbi:MAG: imidazolonepropionase [Anaerolineales bacterium]